MATIDKKVKRKKGHKARSKASLSTPEAAHGAGKHSAYKMTKRGADEHSLRKAIEEATVRSLTNRKKPPPKRSNTPQDKSDAELMRWLNKELNKRDAPKRRHRKAHP